MHVAAAAVASDCSTHSTLSEVLLWLAIAQRTAHSVKKMARSKRKL
jgi:hypothetical protein